MTNAPDHKIDCIACRYYYVTWDRDFPNGCRAMGFKSKNPPSLEVYRSSGMSCRRFELKAARPPARRK